MKKRSGENEAVEEAGLSSKGGVVKQWRRHGEAMKEVG
jgi:hypothetical protein